MRNLNFFGNLYESNLALLDLCPSQYYFEELNLGLFELSPSPCYFDLNLFESLKLTFSTLSEFTNQIFDLLPDFLSFKHLHKIDEQRQSTLLKNILFYYNKNLSKILCFSEISSILGHGFSSKRKGSSILAYYCSMLAPLSNVKSDGVLQINE